MAPSEEQQSPLVTIDTVEAHRYLNNPFANHAVRAGIRQDEFIRILLDHQAEMVERISQMARAATPYLFLSAPDTDRHLG
jgi:hypothetical protein